MIQSLLAVHESVCRMDARRAQCQHPADILWRDKVPGGAEDVRAQDPALVERLVQRLFQLLVLQHAGAQLGAQAIGEALPRMVHGGQEFVWGEPVCAGDSVTTETTIKEIYEKDGKGFYVFESVSKNQDGGEVVRATWTNIVRGV